MTPIDEKSVGVIFMPKIRKRGKNVRKKDSIFSQ